MQTDPNSVRQKPKDILKYNGHQYALIRENVSWHKAKNLCEQMGGHLACLETPQESAFVADLLKKSGTDAWIGCSDEEGEWKWINGKPATLPGAGLDNLRSVEHHIHWAAGVSRWNDNAAGARMGCVCEWE